MHQEVLLFHLHQLLLDKIPLLMLFLFHLETKYEIHLLHLLLVILRRLRRLQLLLNNQRQQEQQILL
jgi:hypothetical protein